MEKVHVNLKEHSYDVLFGHGIRSEIEEYANLKRKILLLADDGVPEAYIFSMTEIITGAGGKAYTYIVPRGEESKNLRNFEKITEYMLNSGFKRGDAVLTLGGGMVNDLGGYIAACYMRGIDFISMPTTMIAQVDAAVGGKTAVNIISGNDIIAKNIIGAFYQPKCVISDFDFLSTLNKRDFFSGFAEAIKMALLFDEETFKEMENAESKVAYLDKWIKKSVELKVAIVEKDEKETDIRRCLNFGHTIGHGLEAASGGLLRHGECVALGMLAMTGPEVSQRLRKVLTRFELPVSFGEAMEKVAAAEGINIKETVALDIESVSRSISYDKKGSNEGLRVILVDEIGSWHEEIMGDKEILKRIKRIG